MATGGPMSPAGDGTGTIRRAVGAADLDVSELIGLLLAGMVLAIGLGVSPPAGVDPPVQRVLAVFLATVVLWIFRPVPYAVSSLLSVVCLYGLGLTDTFAAAVSGFASTLVFFFVLLLLVGHSIAAVDLDEYVATRLVSATSSPRSSFWRLTGAILLLAFVMPSGLARAVTFMPVVDQINETFGLPDDSPFRRLGYYLIGHVNNIGSLALMTGGGMAITTAELVNALVRPITWIEWAVYMAPPAVLLYLASMGAASRFYDISDVPIDDRDAPPAPTPADPPAGEPPDPMTWDQRLVVGTLLVAIALWIVGSFVGLPALVPAMLIVFVLALPGVRIITAEAFGGISWGVIFLIGAMLSLLDVMQSVGALTLIIEGLLAVLPTAGHPLTVLPLLLGIAILVRGTFSAVSPALLILLPILVEFAGVIGINPLFLSFTLVTILAATTFLPFNVSTVLLAYETGPLTLWEVFGLGLVTLLLAVVVVTVSWGVYWPLVDGLIAGLF